MMPRAKSLVVVGVQFRTSAYAQSYDLVEFIS